jgi:DNA-binding GntR family transcriptional regulator
MTTEASAQPKMPLAEPDASTPRRPLHRPRSIPEQIADHLGMAILRGGHRAGERIGEQEMAELYGVSRGPVREAIRFLQARGMVTFEPRRGAFAIDISLDLIADLFNTRAALLGMAGRCFTRAASARGLEQLAERLARLRSMAPIADFDPIEFAQASGRVGASIYNHCGNATLTYMLREQGETSLWGFIWRERPLDYFTSDRRASCIADYTLAEAAARSGGEAEAEAQLRKIIFDSRDRVLNTLMEVRGGLVDNSKIIR